MKMILILLALITSSLFSINSEAKEPQAISTTTVSFTAIDKNGKKIQLKDLLGKTVLLTFYKAGCTVCARDLKLMRDFYKNNVHNNFVLIGVNLDATKTEFDLYKRLVELTISKDQQFPLVWRFDKQHADSFGTISFDPTHFVISSSGQIIFKREGTFLPADWDNLWEQLGN